MAHLANTAQRAGVPIAAINDLTVGCVHSVVAYKLGVTVLDIESFLKGKTSAGMAARLGIGSVSAANALAQALDRNGAVGVIVGLLLAAAMSPETTAIAPGRPSNGMR